MEDRPRVPTFLNSIADYANTIPNLEESDTKSTVAKPSARMGTVVGVYLPCVQNIFGVILFIRLSWVVGTAGIIWGFGIVFTCCCVVNTINCHHKYNNNNICVMHFYTFSAITTISKTNSNRFPYSYR